MLVFWEVFTENRCPPPYKSKYTMC